MAFYAIIRWIFLCCCSLRVLVFSVLTPIRAETLLAKPAAASRVFDSVTVTIFDEIAMDFDEKKNNSDRLLLRS